MPNITREELELLRSTWKARVADFRASVQSQIEWCAANDFPVRQLQYWLRKFPEQRARERSQAVKWTSVDLGSSQERHPHSPLSIRVGSAVIEIRDGYDPTLLLDVVKVLQSLC